MRFTSFFSKLVEMMERMAGHLEYVTEYGERFINYPKVQSVSIIPFLFLHLSSFSIDPIPRFPL